MTKIAEHNFSRFKVSIYSVFVGLLIGLYNSFFPPIDLTLAPVNLSWIAMAIISVVILHESIHGAMALLLGFRPLFGLKLPLVYVTFNAKIPRGQFVAIALAPFIILDTVFGILFAIGLLKVFSYFCLIANTLGSVGDLWIVTKLISHSQGTLVQDTKTGIEVWKAERGALE